eukprot:TRINITY_DN1236_c1_g1_i14.p1 TRINITY_DN1236_c1_g1~~TRINITY_DN1236_c1_g1_i14.p1  ORF type:complete len:234 (-),score=3.28 TRINITY_DN1236_c1_g1_i14:276-899(-)
MRSFLWDGLKTDEHPPRITRDVYILFSYLTSYFFSLFCFIDVHQAFKLSARSFALDQAQSKKIFLLEQSFRAIARSILLEVMNLQELQKNLAAARLLALQQSQSEQTQFFQQFRASERALEQKVGNSNVHHETTQKELLLIVIIFFIKILQIEKHVRDLQKYFAMKGYKFSMLALYIDVIGYILSMIFVYSCSDRLHVLHTFEFFIS